MTAQGWRKRQIQNVIIKSDINHYLYAMIGRPELVDSWWHTPNKAFNMLTPNEVYQENEDGRKRVYTYVLSCSEGKW